MKLRNNKDLGTVSFAEGRQAKALGSTNQQRLVKVLVTGTRRLRSTIVQRPGDDVGTRFPEVDRQPTVNSAVKHWPTMLFPLTRPLIGGKRATAWVRTQTVRSFHIPTDPTWV